jgi:hypothetical protein
MSLLWRAGLQMKKKFTEFKLEKFKIWHENEVPENISEIRDFFSRGYDKLLLAEAEKKGEAYVEPINNLIHDYKIMLQNPSKYGL